MPARDFYLLVVGGFAAVGAAIAATSLGAYGAGPFALVALAFVAVALLDAARAPRVLLVGAKSARGMSALENVLNGVGCALTRCEGPTVNDCPVLSGADCPYRDHLASAVVVDDAAGDVAPCGEALGIRELRLAGSVLADPVGKIDLLKSAKSFAAH